MKKTWSVLALVGSMGLAAMGEPPVITSFPGNGIVTWTYPTNDVGSYRVEWAPQAGGPWTNFAGAALMLDIIAPTGETMSAAVPMFYRVVAELNSGDYLVVDLSEGPEATNYPVSYLTAVPPGGWTDEYKTTKLVLRRIPAIPFSSGYFMGSQTNELGHGSDEWFRHVTLTQPFYVGVFEVTQKQWERVFIEGLAWPSYFTNAVDRETRPVENVAYGTIRGSFPDANWPTNSNVDPNLFMGRLRARTGLSFDLPTEAQWEYACRAGTTTALNSGNDLTNTSNDAHMSAVGRYYYNGGSNVDSAVDTSGGTAKVGSYLPNAWGLYDMHGNVSEWCLDYYSTNFSGAGPGGLNPPGASFGTNRVVRGGKWNDFASGCRSARRDSAVPDIRIPGVSCGFRVALPMDQ